MATEFPRRLTIPAIPAGFTLVTASDGAVIPEAAAARMDNFITRTDGVLVRARGTRRWGQRLTAPSSLGDISLTWRAEDTTRRQVTSTASPLVGYELVQTENYVRFSAGAPCVADTVNFMCSQSGAVSTSTFVAARVIYRIGVTDAVGMVKNPIFKLVEQVGRTELTLLFAEDLLYYANAVGTPVAIAGSAAAVAPGWHVLEVRWDVAAAKLWAWADDVPVATNLSVVPYGTDVYNALFKFRAETTAADPVEIHIDSVQYVTGDAAADIPFVTLVPHQLMDWSVIQGSDQETNHLLVAAENTVWVDDYMCGTWRYLNAFGPSGLTRMFKYRDSVVFMNGTATPMLWDGHSTFTQLSGAPRVQFGCEYYGKLFAAGDDLHPNRVYFTQTNNATGWNTEEVPNPSIAAEAGYFDVPSRARVTALVGDYYGQLVIFTDKGAGKARITIDTSGTTPVFTGEYEPLYSTADCVGPLAWCSVETDIYFVSRRGLHALSTTDRYGGIISETRTRPLKDYWFPEGLTGNAINAPAMAYCQLAYDPNGGKIYLPMAISEDARPGRVAIFDVELKGWAGMLTFGGVAAASITIQSPSRPTMMYARAAGEVFYYGPEGSTLQNYDGTYCTATLRSAILSGRQVEEMQRPDLPHFSDKEKSFKALRLYVHARGQHTVTVKTESEDRPQHATTLSVLASPRSVLDSTFTLDDPDNGILGDHEAASTIPVVVSEHGQWFRWELTAEDDNDCSLLGWALDFVPGQLSSGG